MKKIISIFMLIILLITNISIKTYAESTSKSIYPEGKAITFKGNQGIKNFTITFNKFIAETPLQLKHDINIKIIAGGKYSPAITDIVVEQNKIKVKIIYLISNASYMININPQILATDGTRTKYDYYQEFVYQDN